MSFFSGITVKQWVLIALFAVFAIADVVSCFVAPWAAVFGTCSLVAGFVLGYQYKK